MKKFNLKIDLLFMWSLLFATPFAWAAPAGLTFQGRLVNNDVAVETASVTLTIQVRSPATDSCLLYEETHTLNMTGSDGIFTIKIGGGTRTVNDMALTLVQVFSNTGTAINGLTCTSGATTYTSSSSDTRSIYVSFVDNGTTVNFTSPYIIQSVPYALEAERLAGKSSTDFLQVTANTTQSKVNALMVPATYTELLALLTGASTQYMTSSATNGTSMPVLSSAPSSPAAGTMWYEGGVLKYYDGVSSSVKTLGTSSGTTADTVAKGGQSGALSLGTSDSNDLTLNTNGTARMTILANGNVGIGTASPAAKLDVVGNIKVGSAASGITSYITNGNQISVGTESNQLFIRGGSYGIHFANGSSTEYMTILNTGNVGIGTTGPAAKLHVSGGNILADRAGANDAQTTLTLGGAKLGSGGEYSSILFQNYDSNGNAADYVGAKIAARNTNGADVGDLGFFTVGSAGGALTERMTILNSGNVGIGTTGPNRTLQVAGTFAASGASSFGASGTNGLINIYSQTPAVVGQIGAALGIITGGGSNLGITGYTGDIVFGGGATGTTETARITNSGNVGIGTTSPNTRLDAQFSSATLYSAASPRAPIGAQVTVTNTSATTGSAAGIDFVATSGGTVAQHAHIAAVSTASGYSPNLVFGAADTTSSFAEYMRIGSTGNIGIGTNNPTSKLHVNGGAIFAGGTGTSLYVRDLGSFRGGINNDSGTYLAINGGTNGDTSFAGKVGIGTTAPSQPLHVVGNEYLTGNLYLSSDSKSALGTGSGLTFAIPYNGGANSFIWRNDGLAGGVSMQLSAAGGLSVGNTYGSTNPGSNVLIQGSVGIGTTSPTAPLHVNGSALATAWNLSSDSRLKTNVQEIENPLDKILNLRGVTFDWRTDTHQPTQHDRLHDIGVIAQEVEKQFPEAVTTAQDGFKSVAYSKLVAPLIGAVKEIYARITGIDREIASLKADNSAKEQKIKELEGRLENIEKALSKGSKPAKK